MDDIVATVRRSLAAETRAEFDRRVEQQAAWLREEMAAGALDETGYAVGLELEAYAVDDAGRLATIPDEAFTDAPMNKELGVHNVELNTEPDPLDSAGLAAQAEHIAERVAAAREALSAHDRDLALDAMWTIPPEGGTLPYLSAARESGDVHVAEHMRPYPRYVALDNDITRRAGGTVEMELPGATLRVPNILAESLATSIQPHLQVPDADAFPEYYRVAIRTLGPVLSLATNSPLLPHDCYEDPDPDRLLDGTHHELRVPVFEESINVDDDGKVRFPEDVAATTDVVDLLVDDAVRAPFLREMVDGEDAPVEEYADNFWELDHKRGTFWRWLRAVVGGTPVGADGTQASIRIEYRPLPTQPTVEDVVGLQALVSGLIPGLVAADHPVADLDWAAAGRSFYNAVANGPDAELYWVTADGERTQDTATIRDEVFAYAREGLRGQGLDDATVDDYLGPIEARREVGTPSTWKLDRVREELDDGAAWGEAVEAMQRDYFERSASGTPFAEWD